MACGADVAGMERSGSETADTARLDGVGMMHPTPRLGDGAVGGWPCRIQRPALPCPALLVSPFLGDATNPAFLGSWASSSRFRSVPYGAAPLDRGLLLSSLRGVLVHRQPKEHERPFRGMWLLTSAHAFFCRSASGAWRPGSNRSSCTGHPGITAYQMVGRVRWVQ